MTAKERFAGITKWFEENMPAPQSELRYSSAYELLVAVMLSAQCTDKRVNLVTPALFKMYPTAEKLSEASFDELYPLVSSVSYPNSKARHLIGMARMLTNDFCGIVPSDIDSLMSMPGVGRKTANVVASIIYDQPVIAVDTHVFRISHRLGLSDSKTPEAVEKDLEKHFPKERRARVHHWLILHGRYVCTARKPECTSCGLSAWCKEFQDNNKENV